MMCTRSVDSNIGVISEIYVSLIHSLHCQDILPAPFMIQLITQNIIQDILIQSLFCMLHTKYTKQTQYAPCNQDTCITPYNLQDRLILLHTVNTPIQTSNMNYSIQFTGQAHNTSYSKYYHTNI